MKPGVAAGLAAGQDDGLTSPTSGQLHVLSWPGAALQLATLQHQQGALPHEVGTLPVLYSSHRL